ncbi:helix-turn-helix domain-containing protein [Micrococcus luteus]|uniref:helix-turn-helix domain-containing protein n=1 Tax=Micrococcus luteus TaxID=1270 RepID=UPI0019CFC556|nr:helix-turn-helix domain-containing protein [Micrococcus luteus]MBN6749917.1 helix-turn-helix domain-containing protein [Micrococcus luteus]MBN6759888.1 helix-turn-helix domain-containing protein [Micrococcus luteus]MBN6801416.1 helix-turn-helix domain-containing protein [Micrococcus luteus]
MSTRPVPEPVSRALWLHALTHSEMRRGARLAGLALATRATSSGRAHLTVPDVAELAGVHPSTARRALADLHAAGYLEPAPVSPYSGAGAARTTYRLTVPVPAVSVERGAA